MSTIRRAVPQDAAAIRTVHEQAFATTAEANLVDQLDERGKLALSLIAERGQEIVGHIAFSPVTIEPVRMEGAALGLAPLAVLPALQRQGIGAPLVTAGLEQCREAGVNWVVVLGDPNYYHRFGFRSAEQYGLSCDFDAPKEAFMAIRMQAGAPEGCAAVVRYQPEFNEV